MFNSKSKVFYSMFLYFKTFKDAENWLKSINAIYWEIGL